MSLGTTDILKKNGTTKLLLEVTQQLYYAHVMIFLSDQTQTL